MTVQKACIVCQAVFRVSPNRAASAMTCSRACKGVALRARYMAERPKKECPTCGKKFDCPACHADRRIFCSERCKWASESAAWSVKEKSEGGAVMKKSDGYFAEYRPRHPFASKRGWVQQHRLVMEERMRKQVPDHDFLVEVDGIKYLRPELVVHHRDLVKTNNDSHNLTACTGAAHRQIHHFKPVDRRDVWPLTGLFVKDVALSLTLEPTQ